MVETEKLKKIQLNDTDDLGLVVTPPQTAKFMVSKILPIGKDEKVLDPCTGPGIFVKKLIEKNVNPNNITAYDINPDYNKLTKNHGIKFEIKDYLLSLNPFSYNQFDIIIGNPPYLNKASNYVRKYKKKLKQIYGKINAHETYSMFIVSSIWRLKNGGKLAFITSDSFLTLNTHIKLRKFILSTCKILELVLPPKNLFDSQGVSTSPAILILEKCSGKQNRERRLENMMEIIPRLDFEDDYEEPPVIHKFKQKKYHSIPFCIFFTDVEQEIIDFFENSNKLKDFLSGEIGMHTRNNKKFIAAIEGTELAEIYRKRRDNIERSEHYRIISREELESNSWMPYLKRGGGDQYYRKIMEAVDWSKDAVNHYVIPKSVEFQKEGIVISGVSSRLAARYMPEGCYWDSNKAIGFYIKDEAFSIEYILGLLNSSLYNYIMNGILNNTSSIQIKSIRALPMIKPDQKTKDKVEVLVKKIIKEKQIDKNYDYKKEQKEIDEIIYDYHKKKFGFKESVKDKLKENYSIY